MKILQINNRTRLGGGQDEGVKDIRELLQLRGAKVTFLEWESSAVEAKSFGKFRAFLSGIYSVTAAEKVTQYIKREIPDVVFVHNLYPLISPSVLVAARKLNIPTVMFCHNYRLTCPVYLHLRDGKVCDLCQGGREYWCIINNCRQNFPESIAYALHNMSARIFRLFKDNVSIFVSWSESFKERLVSEGFDSERICVIPRLISIPKTPANATEGEYVAYSGRISLEKGVEVLVSAAKLLPGIPFQIAGNGPLLSQIASDAPENVLFRGWLPKEELAEFYRKARFLVVPSLWFETFGAVAGEAMAHGLPVIASQRGSLQEVVEDGETGLLFEPGNVEELKRKILLLWKDKDLCYKFGQSGRQKALREYSEEIFYRRIMNVLEPLIE